MGYHCLLMGAVLSLAIMLTTSLESCQRTGLHGMPGIPGLPGRDGRNGEKGEKGEPVSLQKQSSQKGDRGEVGLSGPAGKRGQSGDQGPKGEPGDPGSRGEPGDTKPVNMDLSSAFSVARGTGEAPPTGRPIRFTTVITNINEDYNTTSGQFRCRVPGTYYFVYHASSDEQLCVLIKLNRNTLATFCDRKHERNRRQVSSGGLAVYLKKDDNVYLEATDYNRMTGSQAGNSLFSGFLLHAH